MCDRDGWVEQFNSWVSKFFMKYLFIGIILYMVCIIVAVCLFGESK